MTMTSPAFDPANLADISDRLATTLSERFPGITVAAPEALSGGMDTYVYTVRFADIPPDWAAPLILRVYPTPAQSAKAQREAAIQSFVAEKGFPAPRVLLVDADGGSLGLPFMIMERVTGAPAIEAFKNPLKLPRVIRGMAVLQARLHTLTTDGCPVPFEAPLVDRLLTEPQDLISRYDPPGLSPILEWMQAHADLVRDETPALLHLDFHPLNILAADNRMTLLDWSEATLGDRHADVARTLALLWLAAPLIQNPLERNLLSLLRRYLVPAYKRAYRGHLALDETRLRYWEAFHAFRSWAQVAVLKQEGEEALGARAGVATEIPVSVIPAFAAYVSSRMKSFA